MSKLKAHLKSLLASGTMSRSQFLSLLSSAGHSPYVQRHRAALIVDRVRLVSAAFAVLTPLWIVVDVVVFAWPAWGVLAGIRLFSALVFAGLAWPWPLDKTARRAFVMLTVMLVNPPLFYLVSLPLFSGQELPELAGIVAHLYALLPFISLAGLAIFPLTVAESLIFGLPVLALGAWGAALGADVTLAGYVGKVWLLLLIFGVGALAGAMQLRYMMALVSRASQDPLTGAFTRRSGGEIIDLQYRLSERHGTPFAVAFFDLDNFKSINDVYGHEEGDAALRGLVGNLRHKLRRGDVVIRWGGEEFVVILGNIDCDGIRLVMRRILDEWLGERPDGGPLTASIGIAERRSDDVGDWPQLVELADQRMYEAKKRGKARCVLCHGEEIT